MPDGLFPHPPRCHRACGFHRTRRPPTRTLSSFPIRLQPGCPGYQRRDRILRHLISCGPSPCTQLSCAPTTMATLTPCGCLGGFRSCFQSPTSALLHIIRRVSHVHMNGLTREHLGGGYLSTYTCYCKLLSGDGVAQVHPYLSYAAKPI